jgi:hypothetical protein
MVQDGLRQKTGRRQKRDAVIVGIMNRFTGRSFSGLALFLFLLLAHAGTASAVKPTPPLSAECSTLSSTGMVFNVRCVFTDVAGTPPDSIAPAPVADRSVSVYNVVAPKGAGLGEWSMTVQFSSKKSVALPFDAKYSGGFTMHLAVGYDPFNLSPKAAPVPKGALVKGRDGNNIHEFMSK